MREDKKGRQPRPLLSIVAVEFLLILAVLAEGKGQISSHDAVILLQFLQQLHH